MSKKIGYIYNKMLTREAIESALTRASKHKKKRRQVRRALENKEQTIKDIQKILLDESFVPQVPFEKTIWDTSSGKERHVAYVRFFPDAIIHTLVVERLEEIFKPRFDPHSCSAIPKRGGAAAKKYVEKAIQEDPEYTKYCLKLDISKYFQSIDKDVLMKQLHHIIKDKRFLKICSDIINSYIENPEQPEKGIAIGFFPSQWFGNSYLTDLDRYIRTLKGVHYYCRYMDDMVLFSDNKEDLHQAKELIENFLNNFLKLKLKSNYQLFPIDKRPLDFVGYIFYRKYIILRRKTANKTIKQSRRIYKMQNNNNPIDFHNASGFLSRSGQCKHFNSRLFSKRYINNINLENLKGVVKMKACANDKPNVFTFEKYPRGGYILWLRENFHKIEKEEPDSQDSWIYDEYTILIPQYLTNNFIEQHFEEYLENARREEASNPIDRLSSAEDAIQDILEVLAEITG